MNPNSLVRTTTNALIEIIVARGAGAKIPSQTELSATLGVSRTVLREAISKLEFLNILTTAPKKGTVINPVADWKTFNEEVIEWQTRLSSVETA